MFFQVFSFIFLIKTVFCNLNSVGNNEAVKLSSSPVVDLTDEKWDQIQKGQWLVGFFDRETQESKTLEEDWHVFATQCDGFNINVGKVFAPDNPGLYIRFLVTVFPKAFYIKNGVAHEITKLSRESFIDLIKNQKWSTLKPVNFLSNPFSVQMSLLSHLFVHAVNLYNYENAFVQQFVSAQSATDVVFGLTFILVGTVLGLLMTCMFGVLQVFFMDSKESDDDIEEKTDDTTEKEAEESIPEKESSNVRKRK